MFHRLRWALAAVGVIVLMRGGVSLFGAPDYEVLYSARPAFGPCTAHGCFALYILEVGNTGSRPQERVRVRLSADVIDRSLLKPTVRNFGKVERPVDVRDEERVRVFDLGTMKPQERVELQFTMRYDDHDPAPSWQQILLGVEASQGKALPGDPATTALGRMFFTLLGAGC